MPPITLKERRLNRRAQKVRTVYDYLVKHYNRQWLQTFYVEVLAEHFNLAPGTIYRDLTLASKGTVCEDYPLCKRCIQRSIDRVAEIMRDLENDDDDQ